MTDSKCPKNNRKTRHTRRGNAIRAPGFQGRPGPFCASCRLVEPCGGRPRRASWVPKDAVAWVSTLAPRQPARRRGSPQAVGTSGKRSVLGRRPRLRKCREARGQTTGLWLTCREFPSLLPQVTGFQTVLPGASVLPTGPWPCGGGASPHPTSIRTVPVWFGPGREAWGPSQPPLWALG